jgi:hypothetical protein
MNSSTSSSSQEAIFVPIDLEASLGRIEERQDGETMMECNPRRRQPVTRTSSGIPFSKIQFQQQQQSSIAPYPISETDAEIKERQKLTESVPNWNLATPSHHHDEQQVIYDDSHSMMEVTATEEALDDVDDFSLSGDASLAPEDEEEFELERIDDPVSFWEVTPTTTTTTGAESSSMIPAAVTFSSTEGESMEW